MDRIVRARRRSRWSKRALVAALACIVTLVLLPSPAHALSAPVVTTQPSSRTVTVGTGVSFTAVASGSPTPTVQWERNTSGTWAPISGATSTTYTLTAQLSDAGGYRAVFTNSQGSATSNVATLTVQPQSQAPVITTQPVSQTVLSGDTVTFTAAASGFPVPSVQWQRGFVGIGGVVSFSNISGANSTSYSFSPTPTNNGNRFRAIFTNSLGSATTNQAILTVQWAPIVTMHPDSNPTQFPLTDAAATLQKGIFVTVSANPTTTVSLWERSNDGGSTWSPVTSDPGFSTGNGLTVTLGAADDNAQFRATATNSIGSGSVITVAHVGVPPTITRLPTTQNVAAGSTATFITEGTSPTGATVSWSWTPSGGSTAAIPGANQPTLTVTAPSTNYTVKATYTNAYGAATATASLVALPAVSPPGVAPYVTEHPEAATTLEVGQSFTVHVAAGGDPAPTIQWQKSEGSLFADIPGATGASYTYTTPPNPPTTVRLKARFTNASGWTETTESRITNNYVPYPSAADGKEIVPLQTETGTLFVNLLAHVWANPAPTYQWQRSTDGGATWTDIPGATGTTYGLLVSLAENGYRFRAMATNAYGSGSGAVTTLDVGIMPRITQEVTAQTVSGGAVASFTIGVYSPSAYTIRWERASSQTGTFSTVSACANQLTCSFTASLADNGKWYRAWLINAYGQDISPAQKLTVVASVPSAPQDVTAVAGNARATVSWAPPLADGGYPVSSYVVTPWLDSTPLSSTVVTAPTTSTTVAGLGNGVAYTFTVHAVNSLGTGAESSPTAPVTPGTVPGTPTAVAAVDADGAATVTWTAPASDGGRPITSYVITPYVGTEAQSATTVAGPANSALVTGLTNGVGYTFTVRATNVLGDGAESAASDPVTPAGPPLAPAAPTAARGNGQVTLAWTEPSGNGRTISGYVVIPSAGGSALDPILFDASTTTRTITGLTNGVAYRFTVAAVNAVGTGPASEPSDPVTPARTPDAPSGVTAGVGNTRAQVSWTAPAFDGGSPVTGYVITPLRAGVAQAPIGFASTATSQTVGGLDNGVSYTFAVAAVNDVGTGADSTSGPVTPVGVVVSSSPRPSVLGQPVVLRATSTVGNTGTVTFFDGTTSLGSATASNGVATLSTTKLAVGDHSITGQYKASSMATPFVSDPVVHHVDRGATTTTVTVSPSPSVFGETVKVKASVAAVAPAAGTRTGSVVFSDGSTIIGTVSLSSGAATLSVKPSIGSHDYTAIYAGSSAWVGSASAVVTHVVDRAATSVVITSSADPSVSGQSVTLKAKVAVVAPGAGTPAGTVEFYEGDTLLATKPLSSGLASLTVKPTVGAHSYAARYLGSATFVDAIGTYLQTVGPASTTVTLASQYPTATQGHTGTITATVKVVAPGMGTPTGTVDFTDDGVLIASVPLSSGKASIKISTLAVGTHPIVATYTGSPTMTSSASPILVQTIT